MDQLAAKIYLGFIVYGKSTAKYLPYFLPSLKNQTRADLKILAVDNSEELDNENAAYLKNNFPEITYRRRGENLGFARAYNLMIEEAAAGGAEYFLAFNPDMILEPDTVEKLTAALDHDSGLGSATAKILKWDFVNRRKTNIIDSRGIKLLPGLKFVDADQGQPDSGRPAGEILGPSGASAIYRLSALEKVKQDGQYFDERMFMYKEDCDLAYRLALAGYKSKCVDQAVVYHDRSAGGQGQSDLAVFLNRKNKSRQVKIWSFTSQQVIFHKYWKAQTWRGKLAVVWLQFKLLAFALVFEPYLLKEFLFFKKIKNVGQKN